jgi:hypothetical protein
LNGVGGSEWEGQDYADPGLRHVADAAQRCLLEGP